MQPPYLDKSTAVKFGAQRCQPHGTQSLPRPVLRPARKHTEAHGRAGRCVRADRQARWEMQMLKKAGLRRGPDAGTSADSESSEQPARRWQTCWDTPQESPYGARRRTPAEPRRAREARQQTKITQPENMPAKANAEGRDRHTDRAD